MNSELWGVREWACLHCSTVPRPHAILMAIVLLFFYFDAFVVGAPVAIALGFSLLGMVVVLGFLQHASHGPAGRIQPASVIEAALAALAVLGLSRGGGISVVIAVGLVGTAGGLVEAAGRNRHRCQGVAATLYCGAFTGMTSELVLHDPAWVLLAGGLGGLMLSVLANSWKGIGGKLGTIALLGGLGTLAVAMVSGAIGPGAPLHAFTDAERLLVLVISLLSPLLTYTLSYSWGFGMVLGSALPSLLVAILLSGLPASLGLAPVPLAAAWLGASFVGMTAPERLGPHPQPLLLVMGLLFALLDLVYEPRIAGIGGDLGATAAVSVFAVLAARALVSGLGLTFRQAKTPLGDRGS